MSIEVTAALVERAQSYRYESLPQDVVRLAKQCIVDWFGVTMAGVSEAVHERVFLAECGEGPAQGSAAIVGRPGRYTTQQAAMVNGTTSHALDYDDVNLAISGHPSAVVLPALLALAESRGKSGRELIAAFVAGYETSCRVGRLVAPDHMARGYHATGTICVFGAAAACARLLSLNTEQTRMAFGLAGTMSAGLKAAFGTMAKPLHAGLAARNGLLAATLVSHGCDGPRGVFEHEMGFVATHSSDFDISAALDDPDRGFHIRNNLFKYDASCFGTIATLDGIRQIKKSTALNSHEVRKVIIRADRTVDTICNIQRPVTGTEAKFSLRLAAAYALHDIDTGNAESYNDALVNRDDMVALRDLVEVQLVDGWPPMQAHVEIRTHDGRCLSATVDAGVAATDLDTQNARLLEKFYALGCPGFGKERCQALADYIEQFDKKENLRDLGSLMALSF